MKYFETGTVICWPFYNWIASLYHVIRKPDGSYWSRNMLRAPHISIDWSLIPHHASPQHLHPTLQALYLPVQSILHVLRGDLCPSAPHGLSVAAGCVHGRMDQ